MAEQRLIDANALKKWLNCDGDNKYSSMIMHEIADQIDEQPTIDAVPVVRCRECKYRRSRNCPMKTSGSGSYIGHGMYDEGNDKTIDNGFCHMGVKMDGGAEG